MIKLYKAFALLILFFAENFFAFFAIVIPAMFANFVSVKFIKGFRAHALRASTFCISIIGKVIGRMMGSMFFSCHDLKIINSIIEFIAIDMVNYFRRFEFSTKMLFHYIAMFYSFLTINPNIFISVLINRAFSIFALDKLSTPVAYPPIVMKATHSTRSHGSLAIFYGA